MQINLSKAITKSKAVVTVLGLVLGQLGKMSESRLVRWWEVELGVRLAERWEIPLNHILHRKRSTLLMR